MLKFDESSRQLRGNSNNMTALLINHLQVHSVRNLQEIAGVLNLTENGTKETLMHQ
jgi:hypothetical protein